MNRLKRYRELIQNELEDIRGVARVYYQPPENLRLKYPCIIYTYDGSRNTKYGSNKPYVEWPSYNVTIIDSDPESDIPDRFLKLMRRGNFVTFERLFTLDNLNHWTYNVIWGKGLVKDIFEEE